MAVSKTARSRATVSQRFADLDDSSSSVQQRSTVGATQHLAAMVAAFDAAVHDERRSKLLASILKRAARDTVHLDNLRASAASRSENSEGQFMGPVSQRMYDEIIQSRVYDLYGRRVVETHGDEEHGESATATTTLASTRTRSVLTGRLQPSQASVGTVEEGQPLPYVPVLAQKPVKLQALQTIEQFIGTKPKYNPPPGFAASKGVVSNSEGLHVYYSYNGTWQDGQMHGNGTYKFADSQQYDGKWANNRQHGYGTAVYPNGSTYQGSWREGYFHGNGVQKQACGALYTGTFHRGKRHGHGRLELPCGLVYEGTFENDQPHGRGVVTSRQSRYRFEGTFENGQIEGSGVLITPKGERIVRYWPNLGSGWGLSSVLRVLSEEKETGFISKFQEMAAVRSKIITYAFDGYLKKVRDEIVKERQAAEQEAVEQMRKKMLDRRTRLQGLKFKAVEEEDDDESDDG